MRELWRELRELSEYSQCVVWNLLADCGGARALKVPLNPHDGSPAKANDTRTWGTYEEALRYSSKHGLSGNAGGIGFEFANDYAGIDLDDVALAGGKLKPFADEVVRLMDSYTEFSPSGKGLHILFKLNVPLSEFGSCRRNSALGIEMYDQGRYFTITGNVYGAPKSIAERTEAARKVYYKYLATREHKLANEDTLSSPKSVVSEGVDDSDLLRRMFSSQHGAEIRALFDGDTSGYSGDESRADLALCCYLAFWTNHDPSRIDALFRKSGLMRRKWDEKRGVLTYGQMTISKALLAGEEFRRTSVSAVQPPERFSEPYTMSQEMISIQSYIQGTGQARIDYDLSTFQRHKDRKTGYSNIDAKMCLYPGLYVLGAISSLGKTTFCGQMADQLAGMGEHVLYFSLEQTKLELVCKGLSRLMAQNDMRTALTSMEIRRGLSSEALRITRELYAAQTEHEFIIECDFETNVEAIVSTVLEYISATSSRPVVIIDYLQIISPVTSHQTAKDVVDYNVRALKKLQTDNDLVVLVISSLNRSNYLTPIDFSSFKESGGIEYTADVIWGLQLSVMNDELFDKEAKLKAKREAVKDAKAANRDIA